MMMPNAARKGDSVNTGHGCTSVTTIASGEETVIIGGKAAATDGSALQTHTHLVGKDCVPHTTAVNAGSSTVKAGGKSLARVGDSACAGSISSGDASVVVG
tara:strand:- start:604 stop:906 length:303 start_codon:yes stop_codon:yes gene_type:complete